MLHLSVENKHIQNFKISKQYTTSYQSRFVMSVKTLWVACEAASPRLFVQIERYWIPETGK
jgi:hypothetical protein